MTLIWLLLALLALSFALVFHPLFSRRGAAPMPVGIEGNPRAELEDRRDLLLRQLKELELDTRSGTVTRDDGVLLQGEIEGELADTLTGMDALPGQESGAALPPPRRHPVDMAAGIVLMVFVTVVAGLMYMLMGTPFPPSSQPNAPHTAMAAPEVETMVANLAQRLKENPGDLPGWLRLGRAYAVMGRKADAMDAFLHILALQPRHVEAASGIAELEIQSQDPASFELGVRIFADILEVDPNHMQARWILGMVAYRGGDGVKALEMWEPLLQQTSPGGSERATVEGAIADARAMVAGAPH